jgi:hypothetical protein
MLTKKSVNTKKFGDNIFKPLPLGMEIIKFYPIFKPLPLGMEIIKFYPCLYIPHLVSAQ